MGRKIIDRFTNLPVSRQRKYQLRMRALHRCIICGEPAIRGSYCLYHMVKYREMARARVGARRRNLGARSYLIEMAMQPKRKSVAAGKSRTKAATARGRAGRARRRKRA